MRKGISVKAQFRVNDDILFAIVSELQRKAQQPPPGFHAIEHWEKRWKCKRTCAMRYLREGVKAGILERVELRSLSGRYIRLAPFYGPARKKAGQKPPR
jgi:Fic family protein